MIHEAYNKSEIWRRYFALKKGEDLTRQEAARRAKMTRNIDEKVLKEVFKQVYNEQKEQLKSPE